MNKKKIKSLGDTPLLEPMKKIDLLMGRVGRGAGLGWLSLKKLTGKNRPICKGTGKAVTAKLRGHQKSNRV